MKLDSRELCASAALMVLLNGCMSLHVAEKFADFHLWAASPPLGWNSWDYYGTTLTELQARAQMDAMAAYLLPAGYDIFTVDIQWYEPNATGHEYVEGAPLQMDAFSRLQPAENKFPSSDGGKGFKPLADYAHSKGLRFGIHIMRGIPRQAVQANTPIKGTNSRARDIANIQSTCTWNPDMYGVDATTPGGQAYYDSLIAMYAEWGVDYIKVDDIARPYDDTQRAEIEALRRAIDRSGRPIVLSLSPGATPLQAGPHVARHANLWRITDDFWDRWSALREMFERAHAWEPYRQTGAWPDADMLPLGFVEFGRATRFTAVEQQTLMTLWAIAKSPLIFGGDMTRLDEQTLALLTNSRMLDVNQHSMNNRQVSRKNNLIVWAADVPGSRDKYVALFNAQSPGDTLEFAMSDYQSPVLRGRGSEQDITVTVEGGQRLILYVNDAGDGAGYDHAAWVQPRLSGPAGEISLTELTWAYAETGWGTLQADHFVDGTPLALDGKPVHGFGAHAPSTIIYDLPAGYDTFTATGLVAHTGSVVFGVLVDESQSRVAGSSLVRVDFSALGMSGNAVVHDLWRDERLGVYKDAFATNLPLHASGLYRISPLADQ